MLYIGLAVTAFSAAKERTPHPVRSEIVDAVNSNKAAGWVAEEPRKNFFADRSVAEIKGLMGLSGHRSVPIGTLGTTITVGDIPCAER